MTLVQRRLGGGWPAVIFAGLAVVLLFVLPPVYGQYLPQRLADYLIFGLPALAVGLIAGQARLLNVGVGATFGVSAYVVAMLSRHGVLDPFLLMLASLSSGLLVSGLFALYAVVASGLEYLLLTLLTTSAFFTAPLLATDLTGGENGLGVSGPVTVSFGLDPLQGSGFYWLLCAVTVVWSAVSWYLLSARIGRVTVAIGRNPVRAAAMGYSVQAYRIWVTLFSGAIAASGGWLYALAHAFVFPDLLGLANSINAVLYSLIGGVDYVLGPLLGTAALRYLAETLGQQTTQSQIYIGLALLFVVYFLPDGVTGRVRQLLRLRQQWKSGQPDDLAETAATFKTLEDPDPGFGSASHD